MDLIDYTPGEWEKVCQQLRYDVLKKMGIPKFLLQDYPETYISRSGYLIVKKGNNERNKST